MVAEGDRLPWRMEGKNIIVSAIIIIIIIIIINRYPVLNRGSLLGKSNDSSDEVKNGCLLILRSPGCGITSMITTVALKAQSDSDIRKCSFEQPEYVLTPPGTACTFVACCRLLLPSMITP